MLKRTIPLLCGSVGLLLASACSFDPPPYKDLSADKDQDASEMSSTDMRDRLDLREQDMPDLSMPKDLGQDMADQGLPPDMLQDMRGDLGQDMPPDMNATMLPLGANCTQPEQCNSGRCEAFGGQRRCTEACAGSCAAGLRCVNNLCTPEDFCEDMPAPGQGDGPGCANCQKCHPEASCVEISANNGTLYSCSCDMGFDGDGYDCQDINECQNGAAMCDPKADCANTLGSYTCTCKPGYVGDGRTCQVVDPCAACDANATCNAQRQCVCKDGYSGDGLSCQDINECQSGAAMCASVASCINTQGAYTCMCPNGYSGDGFSCQDINECQNGAAMCDPKADCANTLGSYTCTCPPGATGNGLICQLPTSCAQLKQRVPNSPSAEYEISTVNGTLRVYCDMVSDGGVGYTFVRLNSASLGATQQPYRDLCSSYGMEVVTPRSEAHMKAIIQYNNNTQPNLVSVYPKVDNAKGLGQWTGKCQGLDCSFFVTDRSSSRCKTISGSLTLASPGKWSDNSVARSCRDYLETAASVAQTGVYTIDLDGAGPAAAFNVFCGMDASFDGGGWTMSAITSDDNQNNWTWNRRDLWSTNRATFGSLAQFGRDYKTLAIHDMPFKDVLFYHSPSTIWAGYNNVGDGSSSLGQVISQTPSPNCDTTSGYAMTAGTLGATGRLCNTNLYFNPGDYDGVRNRCETITDFNSDESTYGPAWSANYNDGCPFDDVGLSSWGPRHDAKDSESNGLGFGSALSLNIGSGGSAINHLQLHLREGSRQAPEGDNTTSQQLTLIGLSSDNSAGPMCTFGSWDDRGDSVVYQGYVICGIN